MITIKEVMDEIWSGIKFDSRLAKKVHMYRIEFVTRNSEHMAFFGGNLMGVHKVRFTLSDYSRFFDVMLDAEADAIERQISTITTINHEFKISSDALNQTVLYMIHRFLTSPLLSSSKRIEAAVDLGLIFGYRTIAALLVHYFKYPIDTYTAQAVYERLSGRYLIKKLGTWQDVFEYRAKELIDSHGVHYQNIVKYNDDLAIVNILNDMHGRIKDMLKNIYAEFIKVHEQGDKLGVNKSTMIDADGAEIVKDRVHGLDNYKTYIENCVVDKNTFIKYELIDVVSSVVPTAKGKSLGLSLEWMVEHVTGKGRQHVIDFIDLSMVMSYNYLLKNEYVLHRSRDIVTLVGKLKGYILSSREDSADMNRLRDIGAEIVRNATGHQSEQTISAVRNALFLYVCIRAYTKHAYS